MLCKTMNLMAYNYGKGGYISNKGTITSGLDINSFVLFV